MHNPRHPLLFAASDDGGNPDADSNYNSELDDLTPPSISFTKNSLLFGENPPTQRSNGALWLWQGTKSVLPKFVTGAWEQGMGDTRPVEHLYNLIFVRMPTVCVGIFYVKNILAGHPLIVNFGDGTMFEVPSLIVFGIIYVILR
ncbi:hypothetical protein ACHAXR_013128 [Thalassiosira sp. AJA248-18]